MQGIGYASHSDVWPMHIFLFASQRLAWLLAMSCRQTSLGCTFYEPPIIEPRLMLNMQQVLIQACKYLRCAGQWEYPSPTDPSHHTCNEMDLVASQELPTPSSCSSSQSDSSSTADQQDSANLDSMLGMISSQRHTNNSQEPSSNSAQTHTGPLEPEQGSITVTEAAPTDGETTEGSSTAMGETGTDTADSQVPQLQQIEDSNSADDTDGGASSSSPPGHAPSKPASSPKDLAACEAGSACGSAEDADGPAGFRSSAAQPSPADLQQSEQASATAPAAALEGDKPPQASCSEQIRCDDGKHGEGQSGTINGVDSASCQSSASGKEQSQQSEHGNGSAEVDGKAPKTPIRKAPKKGGLVNVQRPAVKGYSIHRLAAFLCHGCLSCAALQQKIGKPHFINSTCLTTTRCMMVGLGPDSFLTGTFV